MAGGSTNHARIAGNFYAVQNFALAGNSCEAFNSDVKVLVEPNGLYTYPDVSVVCGPVEYFQARPDIITNPILLVEVLSNSTNAYDMGRKFDLYRDLPSLQNYILIEQDQVLIRFYQRITTKKWTLESYSGLDEVLSLPALNLEMPLKKFMTGLILA